MDDYGTHWDFHSYCLVGSIASVMASWGFVECLGQPSTFLKHRCPVRLRFVLVQKQWVFMWFEVGADICLVRKTVSRTKQMYSIFMCKTGFCIRVQQKRLPALHPYRDSVTSD